MARSFECLWGQLDEELQGFLLKIRSRLTAEEFQRLVELIVAYGDMCYSDGFDSCYYGLELEGDEP